MLIRDFTNPLARRGYKNAVRVLVGQGPLPGGENATVPVRVGLAVHGRLRSTRASASGARSTRASAETNDRDASGSRKAKWVERVGLKHVVDASLSQNGVRIAYVHLFSSQYRVLLSLPATQGDYSF